jgi:rhodanese-related sulfurtransferase
MPAAIRLSSAGVARRSLSVSVATPSRLQKENIVSKSPARERVARGAILLDVRTPEEFAERHLEGALNIPVQVLAARYGELPANAAIVVYCRSGGRSATASQLLRARGHDVLDIGTMSAY